MPPRSVGIIPPLIEVTPLAAASITTLHDTIAPGDVNAVLGEYPGVTFYLSYFATKAGATDRQRVGFFSIYFSFDGVTYYEQKRIAIETATFRVLGPFTIRAPYFRISATNEFAVGSITLDWGIAYDDNTPKDCLADSLIESERTDVAATFTTDTEEEVACFMLGAAAGIPPAEDVSDPDFFTIPLATNIAREVFYKTTAAGTFTFYGWDTTGNEFLLFQIVLGLAGAGVTPFDLNGLGYLMPFRFIRVTWESTIAASTDVYIGLASTK